VRLHRPEAARADELAGVAQFDQPRPLVTLGARSVIRSPVTISTSAMPS
jgi:hypothetical protein